MIFETINANCPYLMYKKSLLCSQQDLGWKYQHTTFPTHENYKDIFTKLQLKHFVSTQIGRRAIGIILSLAKMYLTAG